ncbi:MAG: hypothetical protein H6853_07780 [Rhodospirillales bacterium]|nr:hypothetical protein [Alphaproteobacteria bacterium]USO03419.1 MAG: hypothetical protein H6853_07780 [Rhodospirillales bacterium]
MTKILPEDPNDAIRKMIHLTQECVSLLESEDEKITRNDAVEFTVNEQNKQKAFDYYDQAAKELSVRIEGMQGKVSPALITDLERLQLRLKQQAAANNDRLGKIEGVKSK